MSFLVPNRWASWASEWGFVHSPNKMSSSEWIAGLKDRRLVRVGWAGEKNERLHVIVRFPRVSSAEQLRERLRTNESLANLPGWKKLKPRAAAKAGAGVVPASGSELGKKKVQWGAPEELIVDETSLQWSHAFVWSRPKADKVRPWVEALFAAVARETSGFDDRCEVCQATRVNGFLMYEGVPMLMCDGCRARSATAGEMAEQQYEQADANYLVGSVYATVAALVGAALWALLAVGTGKLYAAAAIGIGILVALAYKFGAKKLDRIGQVLGGVLTIGSVVLGDILFYAWQVKLLRPDIGFRVDAGVYAFQEMLKEAPGDIVLTLVFGAVGAFVAASSLAKPRFAPKIESSEDMARNKKAA